MCESYPWNLYLHGRAARDEEALLPELARTWVSYAMLPFVGGPADKVAMNFRGGKAF